MVSDVENDVGNDEESDVGSGSGSVRGGICSRCRKVGFEGGVRGGRTGFKKRRNIVPSFPPEKFR